MTNPNWGSFWSHVRRTYQAGEAVDTFDLHSEDPASVERWTDLLHAQEVAVLSLVDYCVEHHDDLIAVATEDG